MQSLLTKFKQLFVNVEFNESEYTYTVNGAKFNNVTQVIKRYLHPFDYGNNGDALEVGRRVHNFAANYPQIGIPSCKREAAVLQFYADNPQLTHVCNELIIYAEQIKTAGRVDSVLYNTEFDSIVINDFKTHEVLGEAEDFNNYLHTPFEDLPQTELNTAILQINLYGLILALQGFGRIDMIITHLPPAGGYTVYKAPDLRQRLFEDLIK
jgi:hypothetical protein